MFVATMILSAVSFGATAKNTSCVLEGKLPIGGTITDIKDCLQLTDPRATEDMLKQACEGLSQMGASLGGSPAKITYAAQCPSGQQASCSGTFGGAMNAYYYKRSAKDLAETKASCQAAGGKWK